MWTMVSLITMTNCQSRYRQMYTTSNYYGITLTAEPFFDWGCSFILIFSWHQLPSNYYICTVVFWWCSFHDEQHFTEWATLNCQPTWWRHQMEAFSALLAFCAGNSPVTGEFLAQRPVTRSFDVFFDLRLNERSSKQSWGWWFQTPLRPLWRHCYEKYHSVRKIP